jgi:adenosylmethionine-8-amino-7-oxononanoate aminotransferase
MLQERLGRLRDLPHVGDVRGVGLLAAVELVEDKESRAPFAREAHVAERLTAAALEAGLVVWPNVGHADGKCGDLVMIAPPFIVTEEEIENIVDRLETALMTVNLTI